MKEVKGEFGMIRGVLLLVLLFLKLLCLQMNKKHIRLGIYTQTAGLDFSADGAFHRHSAPCFQSPRSAVRFLVWITDDFGASRRQCILMIEAEISSVGA